MSHLVDISLLLRNKNYAKLFIGQFVSFFGSMMSYVALPYQIYHETQSSLMVGLLSLVQLIPILFTALLGGVFADRYPRKKLLIYSEFLLAIACLGLAINSLLSHPSVWMIFVIAIIMSAINGFHRPALESSVQQLVAKEDFSAVGALTSFKFSVSMIAGPALGGVLIAVVGLPIAYFIDFATFAISLIALWMINYPASTFTPSKQSAFMAIRESFIFVKSRQELIGSYIVDIAAMILSMPMALFPAVAQSFGGPQILGLLYAAPAIGSLIISVFSGWIHRVKRHGVGIAVSAALWGVAIIGFGLSSNFYIAFVFLIFAGLFDGISGIFRSVMWNETIPQELRGRLAGIEMISYLSGPRLGDTRAGVLAALFGVTFSIVSGGALCVIGVIISCYFLPKFWNYKSGNNNL